MKLKICGAANFEKFITQEQMITIIGSLRQKLENSAFQWLPYVLIYLMNSAVGNIQSQNVQQN